MHSTSTLPPATLLAIVPLMLALMALPGMGVMALLSRLSGWRTLAERYRTDEDHRGDRFSFVTGSMGAGLPVAYRNCMIVVVTPQGFELSLFFPFRFGAPRLFIPWRDVASVTAKSSLIRNYAEITLEESPVFLRVRGAAGAALLAAYPRMS